MRTIKFRFFHPHLSEMDKDFSGFNEVTGINEMFVYCQDSGIEVMQFTGLHCKDKELYDGDIIEAFFSDGSPCRHLIEWDEECVSFVATSIPNSTDRHFFDKMYARGGRISQEWLDNYKKTIIGNKFQNPELL